MSLGTVTGTRHGHEPRAEQHAAGFGQVGLGARARPSLARRTAVDLKLVSEQLGHSTTRITEEQYQHAVRAEHDRAAEQVLRGLAGETHALEF